MTEAHGPSNRLIIICGLSFAGKSTLANEISARFGYTEVDVDETKLDLYGPGIDDEQLTQDEWD
jgi:uridine kinase